MDFGLLDTIISPSAQIIPGFRDDPELAGAFVSGNFEWNHILLYGLYLIKFMLLFAGIGAVVQIIFGGFRYILGSVMEDKEKGRNTLKNVAIGFAIIVLSWTIVDLVIAFLTSG